MNHTCWLKNDTLHTRYRCSEGRGGNTEGRIPVQDVMMGTGNQGSAEC